MHVRVFKNADGSVRVMRLNESLRLEDESEEAFSERMFPLEIAKQPDLQGLPFYDMEHSEIPSSRADRMKWRCTSEDGKMCVKIDPTVVEPTPMNALADLVERASTPQELQDVLVAAIRQGKI